MDPTKEIREATSKAAEAARNGIKAKIANLKVIVETAIKTDTGSKVNAVRIYETAEQLAKLCSVLTEMQEFDQQIAPPRLIAQKRPHLGERLGLDLSAARQVASAAAAGAGMNVARYTVSRRRHR